MISGRLGAALVCAGLGLALAAPAQACVLDNKPSMQANGMLAHLTAVTPTAKTLATWALFIFPTGYRHGATVRFAENAAEMRRVLTPSALSHPWHWTYGDGSTSIGYVSAHNYRRPGIYKITVQAYYTATNYHQWLEFDAVTIHIT